MAASQAFSGARALFEINGTKVGFAGGVSGSEEIDYEPIDVLNLLEVKEHVPVAYRVTLSAQIFRVVGTSLKKQGTAGGQAILPLQENIITSDVLDCTVVDSALGVTIAQFQECRCAGHSFDITARGVVQENVNFVTIRLVDENSGA